MPDDSGTDNKKKVEGWNIRPFDRNLRIACQIQARKEDMYDYEWVQKILREALEIARQHLAGNKAHDQEGDSSITGSTDS
jgi:ribosomal protein L5